VARWRNGRVSDLRSRRGRGFDPRPGATGVDKGAQGAQAPQWPGKKIFFVKIEGLSSLHPAKLGRAWSCMLRQPNGKGVFLSDAQHVYCIAYLIEIRKFCSKKPGT